MAHHHSLQDSPPLTLPLKKSPPLAFQMTSNDALVAPARSAMPSEFPFHAPDYMAAQVHGPGYDYDVQSPMEQNLQGQVAKQAEALRLQHQAFVVERECWEMERERLQRRITALETLLKSSKGHSPARSPVISPYANGAASSAASATSQHRTSCTSAASRLPSIAENDGSPSKERKVSFIKRDNAPHHIDIPADPVVCGPDGEEIQDDEDPISPVPTRHMISPPPPEYRKNAGHTPLRLPSRPTSSQSASPTRRTLLVEGLEDTPTRRNTARNLSIAREVDEEPMLSGPLHLPSLPHQPSSVNFTFEALTARLHWIEEHPDENEPLALSARVNTDHTSDVDASELTVKAVQAMEEPPKETPSLSQGDDTSAADVSPPPASEVSVSQQSDDSHHGGIILKKKTSVNFGAPFGQLRP